MSSSHGQTLRKGQKLLLLYPSANRDERVFDRPRPLRHHAEPQRPHGLRLRCPFLPGQPAGPDGAERDVRPACSTASPTSQLADDAEPPKRAANFVSGYETMPVVFTPTERRSGLGVRPGAHAGKDAIRRRTAPDDGQAPMSAAVLSEEEVAGPRRARRAGVGAGRADSWSSR